MGSVPAPALNDNVERRGSQEDWCTQNERLLTRLVMVGELSAVSSSGAVAGSCPAQKQAQHGRSQSLPRWLSIATQPRARTLTLSTSNLMNVGNVSDPAGLLTRPGVALVGMVGPYILKDEELVEEDAEVGGQEEDTPGRENWRLGPGEPDNVLSMTDIWPDHWGSMYHDQAEADSLNEPRSTSASGPGGPSGPTQGGPKRGGGPKGLLNILGPRRSSQHNMLDSPQPFSQLWVTGSSLYGKLILVLMLAFCLTEVMDNPVKLLTLQGIFLMYLYVGSIAVILCIYIWVLIDSCASLQGQGEAAPSRGEATPPNVTTTVIADGDPEMASMSRLTRFGSLKRAHITRDKTSGTSFYIRVGALAFGLGTLVFNGLEMAMHSMMEGPCLNDVVFVHPVLHGLFTFLQMHFLFVNSQVLVERFGLAARFGFMHLAATNLALWVRLVVWESGNEWTYFVHLAQGYSGSLTAQNIPTPLQLRGFPRSMMHHRPVRDLGVYNTSTTHSSYSVMSSDHIQQVVALHECLNTNSLGQLWTSSMPFLYPFIVQFSLIAAAVTFIMGQNVGRERYARSKIFPSSTTSSKHCSLVSEPVVDCGGASKGLFLGLFCLVTGVVVIIIFLVVKEDLDFPADTIYWLTTGTVASILLLATIMCVVGLTRVRRLPLSGRCPSTLDQLLCTGTSWGVQLYAVFGMLVGAVGLLDDGVSGFSVERRKNVMLLSVSALQILQALLQSMFIAEALRRACLTRHQMLLKPGRQVVTFLLCSNAVLWAYDSFVTQSWLSQELQLRFYGVLAWGVVSRLGLPLLVFYRFHSCVLLLEVWKRSYRVNLLEPGN